MLPTSLALVGDNAEFCEFLAEDLRRRGVEVSTFGDSAALLAHRRAFAFDFYVIDLALPGNGGLELIRVIRLRSDRGVLVISGEVAPAAFESSLDQGADMVIAPLVRFGQVATAIKAVHRRVVLAARTPG